MDLRDYVRVLRGGWKAVVAFLLVGIAASIAITVVTEKEYVASAQIFVAPSPNLTGTSAELTQGNSFVESRVQSYTSIANAPIVTQPVINSLKLKMSQQQLAGRITSDAPPNKVLINLDVTDSNAKEAAALAAAVAKAFIAAVTNIESTGPDGQPVVRLTVIHPPTVPSSPSKPNKVLDIALGTILGLLVGVAFVLIRDILDTSVKGPADLEEFDLPVMTVVPYDKRTAASPIAFRDDPHSSRAEAYRQLRTNLQFVNVDNAPRIIAVTSAVPGEGKTTTAINLAAALADGGFRVCLIEADLRRPTIAKALGIVGDVGFTTALIGKSAPEDVLQTIGRNLAVLTSGPVPPNPSELLITDQARAVVKRVAALADYTIIDTAPLLLVADGAEVAAMADATILVQQARKTTRDQVERSIEALGKVGERPVGSVLNMLSRGRILGDYAYYEYNYRPDRSRRAERQDVARSEGAVNPEDAELASEGPVRTD